jgi:hypothetical protein
LIQTFLSFFGLLLFTSGTLASFHELLLFLTTVELSHMDFKCL